MSKDIYNLQVPISTDLKEQLKTLAKEDDRSLRVFCKKILEDYVKNVSGEFIEDKKDTKDNEDSLNFDFESLD